MKIIIYVLLMLAAQSYAVAGSGNKTHALEEFGDGLYSFRYGTDRTLVLVGQQSVVITDPISPAAARHLQQAITSVTDLSVSDVVYTNSFFNRVAGAEIFRSQGARIVSQQGCADNLLKTPGKDIVPVESVYEKQFTVDAGGASLQLYYFGESYGTCLSVVVAKPANMIMIYGLVNSDAAAIPLDPTLANYYLHNLLGFFDQVEALAKYEKVEKIFGAYARYDHNKGFSDPLGPVSRIVEQKQFWQQLLGVVEADYNNRIPARALGNRLDMASFSQYADFDEKRLKIMTRRVYSLYRIGR